MRCTQKNSSLVLQGNDSARRHKQINRGAFSCGDGLTMLAHCKWSHDASHSAVHMSLKESIVRPSAKASIQPVSQITKEDNEQALITRLCTVTFQLILHPVHIMHPINWPVLEIMQRLSYVEAKDKELQNNESDYSKINTVACYQYAANTTHTLLWVEAHLQDSAEIKCEGLFYTFTTLT